MPVTDASDIWVLTPTEVDLAEGARYASVTLPWTFNRMMLNTGSAGQQLRGLNIAKGIVGQEVLRQELTRRGMSLDVQRKSHRDVDLFDFFLVVHGHRRKLDVKSVNFYSDYATLGRDPISPQLIADNAGYCGPDWRHFFPLLVPHTQILQDKEAYCFLIASSVDFRKDIYKNRTDYALTAFPFGEPLPFFSSKKLCLAREEAGKGFYVNCANQKPSLFMNDVTVSVIGEWNCSLQQREIQIKSGSTVSGIGPFSCISSFQTNRADYERFDGTIEFSVSRNDLKDPVLNASRRNVNVEPSMTLVIGREDFCNLSLPEDYTLYAIGWITKEEFLQACRRYVGWVWPNDRVNRYENQPWSQITDNDRIMLERTGFDDCIRRSTEPLSTGLMKTTGKGSGSCCYVFPNIGYGGGVKETNFYVLPQDLHAMSELVQ